MYNAYEKDIALVNIYFGGSTVFGNKTFTSQSVFNHDQDLSEGGDEFFLIHISWVLWSHWSFNSSDVACRSFSISCFHAWFPQNQRGGTCIAERTEVQVSRIARAGG